MDVAVHFERVVVGFSRYHKYSLGTEQRQKRRGIVAQIIRPNGERDQAPPLRALRGQFDELVVLMRLPKEVQAFESSAAYQSTMEHVASVCRPNEGWLKSVAGEPDAPRPEAGRHRRRSNATAGRPCRRSP